MPKYLLDLGLDVDNDNDTAAVGNGPASDDDVDDILLFIFVVISIEVGGRSAGSIMSPQALEGRKEGRKEKDVCFRLFPSFLLRAGKAFSGLGGRLRKELIYWLGMSVWDSLYAY